MILGDPLVPEERAFDTWTHQLARSILKVEFSPMCTYNPPHSERPEGGLHRTTWGSSKHTDRRSWGGAREI